ncbi:hypothetical protein EX30DRAFT_342674 [Ascodesmis nigricans]|uniref:Uncharacterized protein n=1 Tax=Ascodesmis nigricans TaxID=341454 RepID=A0A4S2MP76_9PEZI|nr:hypothetical protein EX30DRAFT_342674 [Ascodesmis nigricans]
MTPHPRYYQLLLLTAITLTATALPSPQLTTGNVNKLQGKGQKLADSYSHLGVGTHLEGSCGFVGNPDVYGLGIRIGIYSKSSRVESFVVQLG